MHVTEITLEFREVLSILMDTSNVQINRLSGGKYKSTNNLSKYIENILTLAYGYDFTNQADEGIVTLPFFEWDSQTSKYILKDNFKAIIDYLFRQYGDSYCVNSPSMEDSELVSFSTNFLDSFIDIMFQTYDKYSMLLDNYAAEKAKLLNPVKVTTTFKNYNKFKDTPQGAVTIEDLGDDYNTNVNVGENQGETEDMRGTPIERLLELDGYKKLFEEWAYEFNPLFWEV